MSAPRFCPSCGRPVPPENSFCAWCGTPMTPMAPAAPPATPPPAAAPAAPGAVPPPPPGAVPYGYPAPTYVLPRKADTGTLLSGTFDVWIKGFGSFFVVYLVLSLVTGGLSLAGSYLILGVPFVSGGPFAVTVPSVSSVVAFVVYEIVIGVIAWIFGSMVLGGVVDYSVRRYRGENARIMDSISRGLQRVLSIMGANLLVTIITLGVIVLWVVALVLGALSLVSTGGVGAGLAAVCGALIAIPFVLVFVVYIDIALCLYAPLIMMEGQHAIDSLGRSWNLTKGHKWSLFWSGLVLGILLVIVNGAVGAVGTYSGNAIVQLVTTAIATAITGAWFAILTAVGYDLITKQPQPSVWPPTYTPPAAYPPR